MSLKLNNEIQKADKMEKEDYDYLQLEWLRVLKEAEEDVKNNRITPINETFINIRKKLNT